MKISALLLIQFCALFLNVRSNPCRWLNDGADCVIECLEGANSYTISGFVQSVYDDDEYVDCHTAGVKLILPRDVTGYTLKSNWLVAVIKITELEIDCAVVDEFSRDVFASPIFSTVKKLTLKNIEHLLYQEDIRNYVFDGLDALEDLEITNSAIKIYDEGMLNYVNNTLKSFVLTGMGKESPVYIEKFIGGAIGGNTRTLANVEFVKIEYNLRDYINYKSFRSIPNVRELDLSGCNITVLTEQTFETLGSKLELLNLERNSLKTLPSNIFRNLQLSSGSMLPKILPRNEKLDSSSLTIRLNDNLWNCDCNLEHLKDLLNENINFVGEILCTTPLEIEDYPIRETEFCPYPVTTTTLATTSTTTENTTDPIDSGNDLIEKSCYVYSNLQNSRKIFIKTQMQAIRLNVIPGGVSVILDKTSSNLILIWFKSEKFTNISLEQYQNENVSHCITDLPNPIYIKDLEIDTTYTFCLMNADEQTVSPLDCISYHYQDNDEKSIEVWLYQSSKPVIISVIVASCFAYIGIGMIIGYYFFNKNDGKRISFNCLLALQCGSGAKTSLHPEAINSNFDDNNTIAIEPPLKTIELTPPLPPHPIRDRNDDDVYYEIVKN